MIHTKSFNRVYIFIPEFFYLEMKVFISCYFSLSLLFRSHALPPVYHNVAKQLRHHYEFIHSLIHPFIHQSVHSFIHSFIYQELSLELVAQSLPLKSCSIMAKFSLSWLGQVQKVIHGGSDFDATFKQSPPFSWDSLFSFL